MDKSLTFLIFICILTPIIPFNEINNSSNELSNTNYSIKSTNPILIENYDLSNYITQNVGQIPNDEVIFHSSNSYFLPDGVVFRVIDKRQNTESIECKSEFLKRKMAIYKMQFLGADYTIPYGVEALLHNNNYFYGNDSSQWYRKVPNYKSLIYENLYPGVDLFFKVTSKGLKYEFIVHPGGDINDIKLGFDGATIHSDGQKIFIETEFETIIDGDLYVYQPDDPNKMIPATILVDDNIVTYDIQFDNSYDLIIDPLIYSTYIGGNNDEYCNDIAVDESGCLYLTGETISSNFPTTPGVYNTTGDSGYSIFLTKLNSNGSNLVYSTFIGGNDNDYCNGIALDVNQSVYLAGHSYSDDFPTTPGAYDRIKHVSWTPEIIIMKIISNGSNISHSTFVGTNQIDHGYGITIDNIGNSYVTGITQGDFPTTADAYDRTRNNIIGQNDLFVLKLNYNGSKLLYSTFLGGTGFETKPCIDIDSIGNAYIAGSTGSGFQTTTGAYDTTYNGGEYDIFVSKLSANGSSLIYSTYIGSSAKDEPGGISVDQYGCVYVAGYSGGSNYPTTVGAYDTRINNGWDVVVTKLDKNGTTLIYSTFIGVDGNEDARDILVDRLGNAYITGGTSSSGFPTTVDHIHRFGKKYREVFITVLNNTGASLDYSTLITGSQYEGGFAITLDDKKNIYAAGHTNSNDFPITKNAYNKSMAGDHIFALKIPLARLPGVPENLSRHSGDKFINVTWTRPFNYGYTEILNYSIYRSQISGNTLFLETINNNTYFNDTDVEYNQTYFYQISAVNRIGEGLKSIEINGTPFGLPGAPKNVLPFSEDERIRLIWSPPDITGGKPILYYNIHKGTVPNGESFLTQVDSNFEYNDTDVINGQIYYYNISAVNELGEGPFSQEVYAIPGRPPGAPTSLTAEADDELVYLTWSEPTDNGGFDISGYHIYRGNLSTEKSMINLVGDVLEFNDTTVTNGQEYHYHIIPINVKGEGDPSLNVSVIPGSVPSPPLNLKTIISKRFINLTWETPLDDGGFPEIEYKVYRGVKQNSFEIVKKNITDNWFDNINLEDGVTYYFKVQAVNLIGHSPLSEEVFATTPEKEILPPMVTLFSPKNGAVINDTKPILQWSVNYTGSEKIDYTIFLDNNYPPEKKIKQNLVTKLYEIETELDDGDYFWQVIPWIGSKNGSCESGIWMFTIDTPEIFIPNVNLKSPENNSEIYEKRPKLTWSLDYLGSNTVSYDVYLDTINPPKKIAKSDSFIMEYTPTFDLEATTYYWQVIPKDGLINGSCLSGVWSFIIDIDISHIYNIELTLDRNIVVVNNSDAEAVELTIQNIGKETDYVTFSTSGDLSLATLLDVSLSIPPGEKDSYELTVTSEGKIDGIYKVIITAISIDGITNTSKELTVVVKTDDVNKNGEKKETYPDDGFSTFFTGIIISIVVILIIVLIIIVLFFKKRKNRGGDLDKLSEVSSELSTKIENNATNNNGSTGNGFAGQNDQIQGNFQDNSEMTSLITPQIKEQE